jgi:hypothetical protein
MVVMHYLSSWTKVGLFPSTCHERSAGMAKGAHGFFDVDARLAELSAKGDDLERVNARVDLRCFGQR